MEVGACQFYGNNNIGLLMSYCVDAIVIGNRAHDNGTGLSLDSASLVTATFVTATTHRPVAEQRQPCHQQRLLRQQRRRLLSRHGHRTNDRELVL